MSVLFGYTCDKREIDPSKILVETCSLADMRQMQPLCSRAIWRAHPAYYLSRFVVHDNDIIGLIYLGMPVFSMLARDRFLHLAKEPSVKGRELLSYPDLAVCVGVQPIAWHWNIGKLCAMLAPGLGPDWQAAAHAELKGIVTTSYYGRSSQYNRIYQRLGETAGFGDLHVPDAEIYRMQAFLRSRGVVIEGKSGIRTSRRMRVIQEYYKRQQSFQPGILARKLQHGQIRHIYFHAADPRPIAEIIADWYARWGRPRWERTKGETAPYRSGIEEHEKNR